jgi:hypothetical protein
MKCWLLFLTIILLNLVGMCLPVNHDSVEEITYPLKPKTTEISEIQESWDSLVWNVQDLGGAMAEDVKENGYVNSISTHRKYYGAIFLYLALFLLWKRNRRR